MTRICNRWLIVLAALICCAVTLAIPSQAQAEESGMLWGENYGGSGIDYFYDTVSLADGGYIGVGHSDLPSADLGSGVQWGSVGFGDAIAVRVAADGTVLWAKNYGGYSSEYFHAAVADGNYLYVVGSSIGASTNIPSTLGASNWITYGHNDGIVLKIDLNTGVPIWAKNFGSQNSDWFWGVTIMGESKLCIVGESMDAGFYPEWGHVGASDLASDAIALAVDAETGTVLWHKNYGGFAGDRLFDVAYVPGIGLYACGESEGESTEPASPTWGNAGGTDGIVLKMDENDGSLKAAWNHGGTGDDSFEKVVAPSDGSIAIVGSSDGASSTLAALNWGNNGMTDMVALKLNTSTDTVAWTYNYGGAANDLALGVVEAPDGGLYMTGGSSGVSSNMTLLGAPREWGNAGGYDGIVVKIDPAVGSVLWAQNYGSVDDDVFYAASASGDGSVHAAGISNGASTNLVGLGAPREWGSYGSIDMAVVKVATRYELTVLNGADMTNAGPYFAGTAVSIKAAVASPGQIFNLWATLSGGVLGNAADVETTYIMPARDATVGATYKALDPTPVDPDKPTDPTNPTGSNGSGNTTTPKTSSASAPLVKTGDDWIITTIVAVVLCAGGALTLIYASRKAKLRSTDR